MSHEILIEADHDGRLIIRLSGPWTLHTGIPSVEDIETRITGASSIPCVGFDTRHLAEWDSAFLAFIKKILTLLTTNRIAVDMAGLPSGVRQLISLSAAVPEKKEPPPTGSAPSLITRLGGVVGKHGAAGLEMIGFIGEATLAFLRLFSGNAGFRRVDLFRLIQECGVDALPIVSLISVLVGLILAFVGVIQLQLFGAQLYIADLVGIGMVLPIGFRFCPTGCRPMRGHPD